MKFSFVSIISKAKNTLRMEKSTSSSKNLKVTDEELESLREGNPKLNIFFSYIFVYMQLFHSLCFVRHG